MQRFSKEELQDQAHKFMAAHGIDSFLATEDGNFFHPKDKNLAHDHNNKNVKGEVIEFNAKKVESKNQKVGTDAKADADAKARADADAKAKADADAKAKADADAKTKAPAKPKAKK